MTFHLFVNEMPALIFGKQSARCRRLCIFECAVGALKPVCLSRAKCLIVLYSKIPTQKASPPHRHDLSPHVISRHLQQNLSQEVVLNIGKRHMINILYRCKIRLVYTTTTAYHGRIYPVSHHICFWANMDHSMPRLPPICNPSTTLTSSSSHSGSSHRCSFVCPEYLHSRASDPIISGNPTHIQEYAYFYYLHSLFLTLLDYPTL